MDTKTIPLKLPASSEQTEDVAKRRFEALDIIRILSALLVLIYHISGGYGRWYLLKDQPISFTSSLSNSKTTQIFTSGFVGVYMFFMISGFVIPFTISKTDYLLFLKNRLSRIYKPYLPILILTFILSYLLYGSTAFNQSRALLSSATLLGSNLTIQPYTLGSSWTLSHELYFYFLVFLLLFFTKVRTFLYNWVTLLLGIATLYLYSLSLGHYI